MNPVVLGALYVISLNIAAQPDPSDLLRELKPGGRLAGADVYLLQEVVQEKGKPDVAAQLARDLGMYSYFTATNQGAAGSQNGLAILSRYPLQDQRVLSLPHCNLRFRSRTRMAQHAVVDAVKGPVHLYNVHLDTRINPGTRLDQLRPILADAAQRQGPTIIGGDFNTNPLQWLGNVFPLPAFHNAAGQTLQFMQKQGYGSALPLGTTTHDLPGFQLDWVFVKGLKLGDTQVQPLAISDHHAVRVRMAAD